MRLVAALMIVLTLTAVSRAEHGAPSNQTLADMGLSGLEVMSDAEAMAIRGSGFDPGQVLSGFADYQAHKAEFKERVKEFKDRIDGHVFRGTTSFQKHKASFQANVDKFRTRIH